VHGSAPDIAGQDIANPSGLLLAAVQMLVHVGEAEIAETIKNAWLVTLESGLHTGDIYREGHSQKRLGTRAFTDAIIERLGQTPAQLLPVQYRPGGIQIATTPRPPQEKQLCGVDVFLDWGAHGRDPAQLGRALEAAVPSGWHLKMITNRGVKVFPDGIPETFCTDHWRCRFLPTVAGAATFEQVLDLLRSLGAKGLDVIKTEHLYTFDGERGYSLGQGE
jgi:isocitrate dehydrogenase